MVATDGHRLALVEVEGSKADAGFEPVLVSKKILDELGKLDAADDAPVTIVRGTNHIGFAVGSRKLFSKLDERRFPDYEKVISKENDKKAVVPREELLGAVRRIALLSGDRTKAVSLAFDKGSLDRLVRSQEVGDGSQEIPATYDDTPVTLRLNARYLEQFLEAAETKDVQLFVKDEQAQCQGRPGEPLGGHPELSLRRHADADVKGFVEILSLTTDAFRNLASARLEFHPRLNLMVGDNGQGKTNLLEALAMVSGRASFRTRDLAEVRTHLAPRTVLSARVRAGGDARADTTLGLVLAAGVREHYRDGRRVTRLTAARALPAVFLTARDLSRLSGPAAERRRALDRAALAVDARTRAHARPLREGPRSKTPPPRPVAEIRRGRDGRLRGNARRGGRPPRDGSSEDPRAARAEIARAAGEPRVARSGRPPSSS